MFVKSTRYQVNLGISSSLKVDMSCSIYAPADKAGKYPGKAEGVDKLLKKGDWNRLQVEAKGKNGRKRSSLSFHSLRHSFNSAMANTGVTQEIRQRLTGILRQCRFRIE